MTQKPGTAGAIAAVVVGYLIGTAIALQFAKPAAPGVEAAAATSGR
jgi:hypothetical protein